MKQFAVGSNTILFNYILLIKLILIFIDPMEVSYISFKCCDLLIHDTIHIVIKKVIPLKYSKHLLSLAFLVLSVVTFSNESSFKVVNR